jgi:hypothetical protein
MAAEILPGKTILEALNSDLVCDAINRQRVLFLQIVYGQRRARFGRRSPIARFEDLGKGCVRRLLLYGTLCKGPRYLEMAEGYVLAIALDEGGEIIGYKFVNLGKMMDAIKKGGRSTKEREKSLVHTGRSTKRQGLSIEHSVRRQRWLFLKVSERRLKRSTAKGMYGSKA